VHASPSSMMMAVSPLQHSFWLGHAASSHTVPKEEDFITAAKSKNLATYQRPMLKLNREFSTCEMMPLSWGLELAAAEPPSDSVSNTSESACHCQLYPLHSGCTCHRLAGQSASRRCPSVHVDSSAWNKYKCGKRTVLIILGRCCEDVDNVKYSSSHCVGGRVVVEGVEGGGKDDGSSSESPEIISYSKRCVQDFRFGSPPGGPCTRPAPLPTRHLTTEIHPGMHVVNLF